MIERARLVHHGCEPSQLSRNLSPLYLGKSIRSFLSSWREDKSNLRKDPWRPVPGPLTTILPCGGALPERAKPSCAPWLHFVDCCAQQESLGLEEASYPPISLESASHPMVATHLPGVPPEARSFLSCTVLRFRSGVQLKFHPDRSIPL